MGSLNAVLNLAALAECDVCADQMPSVGATGIEPVTPACKAASPSTVCRPANKRGTAERKSKVMGSLTTPSSARSSRTR